MIAVDTSIVVAIGKGEPEHFVFGEMLAAADTVVGTPSLVEAKLALSSFLTPDGIDRLLNDLVTRGALTPVAFTPEMAEAAVQAFRTYGKGQGHPARLNFGDCLSYAVAKVLGVPLLFKGEDFSHTDIEPAWRP